MTVEAQREDARGDQGNKRERHAECVTQRRSEVIERSADAFRAHLIELLMVRDQQREEAVEDDAPREDIDHGELDHKPAITTTAT